MDNKNNNNNNNNNKKRLRELEELSNGCAHEALLLSRQIEVAFGDAVSSSRMSEDAQRVSAILVNASVCRASARFSEALLEDISRAKRSAMQLGLTQIESSFAQAEEVATAAIKRIVSTLERSLEVSKEATIMQMIDKPETLH